MERHDIDLISYARGEGREKALSSYRACSSQGMAGILIEEGWWRDVWNGWARFDAPAAMRNIRPNRTLQHILILSLLIFARPGDALFTTPLPRSIERDLSLSLSRFLSFDKWHGKGRKFIGMGAWCYHVANCAREINCTQREMRKYLAIFPVTKSRRNVFFI